jgi:hypothetical protein
VVRSLRRQAGAHAGARLLRAGWWWRQRCAPGGTPGGCCTRGAVGCRPGGAGELHTARAALDSLPGVTTMGSLSPTHGIVFPLVLDLGAQWTMRLPSLWPATSGRAQDEASQDRLRRLVASDIDAGRPGVLLVLRPGGTYAWLGPDSQRDWVRWLGQLPEGAAALAPTVPGAPSASSSCRPGAPAP